jgi:hypothetical protein
MRWPSLSSSPWILAYRSAGSLSRRPHDQCGEDVVDRWPSGLVRVGPPSAHEAVMPAQDRVRSAQSMRGLGLVRRSTAAYAAAQGLDVLVQDVRPVSKTSPITCWKISYFDQ